MIFRITFLFVFFINLSGFSQNLSLATIFSDNMVLQQNTKVAIWGWSFAGDEITIKASWGQTSSIQVDASGKWSTTITTTEAGGPYELSVLGVKSELKIKNILLGEVWLCSGQSNMEMTFTGWPPRDTVYKAASEVMKIGNPKIRMFTVTKSYSLEPQENCKGSWKEANATSLKNFSATAYYFGLELYKKLNVPIGLINTSYEGTQIKSWTSIETLSIYPEFSALKADFQEWKGNDSSKFIWLEKHPKIDLSNSKNSEDWVNLNFNDSICSTTNYSDLEWRRMKLPVQWEQTSLGKFDGVVWYRKVIDLPDSWKGKDLQIHLPIIDAMDQTWVNGVKVGAMEGKSIIKKSRVYNISGSLVVSTKLLIAIRVIDYQGKGGVLDSNVPMYLSAKNDTSQKINIGGNWRYLVVAECVNNTFYLFDINNREYQSRRVNTTIEANTATSLYNAMIYPLAPYTIKGFIWYQGESNIGNGKKYSAYLASMVGNWRALWKEEALPIYFVQIAPFKYSDVKNTESAVFRNAQRLSLDSIKNSGMVVTLDIGDVNIIHPSKKKEVGERLAYYALAKTYKKDIVCSGPLYKSFSIEGQRIRLNFDYAENGLVGKDLLKEFEIAGADKKFIQAQAKIENNTIIVFSDKIDKPLYVRYAWRNGSMGSFTNKSGLPASTFTTE